MTIGKITVATPVRHLRHLSVNTKKRDNLEAHKTALTAKKKEIQDELDSLQKAMEPLTEELNAALNLKPSALDDTQLARIRNCILTNTAPRLENNKAVFIEMGNTGRQRFYISEADYFQGKEYFNAAMAVEAKIRMNREAARMWQMRLDMVKKQLADKTGELNAVKDRIMDLQAAVAETGDREPEAEEKAAIQAEWDKSESERPMREWKRGMADSDGLFSARTIEEIIGVMSEAQRAALPEEVISAYNQRIELRKQKPE